MTASMHVGFKGGAGRGGPDRGPWGQLPLLLAPRPSSCEYLPSKGKEMSLPRSEEVHHSTCIQEGLLGPERVKEP